MTGDEAFMALALAEAVKGDAAPNPHVGAVVVRDGRVVGRGFHLRPGQHHAEVMALREAGEAARGATLYVTLEPCNHHGRTPPCTEAVLAAGVARVVVGVRDPNPHVTGGGDDRLRAAGLEVVEGVGGEACSSLVRAWARHVRTGLPYVRLKLAVSLDGRIAAAGGASQWLTGETARREVHALRRRADAVMVGVGTALADDPSLTARDAPPIEARSPARRVVVDSAARLPPTSKLAVSAREVPTWLFVAEDAPNDRVAALVDRGVQVERTPRAGRGLDLHAVATRLGAAGVVDVLVEGGGALAGALLEAGLVDELHWFVAPLLLGADGVPSVVGPTPASPAVAQRFSLTAVDRFADDVRLVLRR